MSCFRELEQCKRNFEKELEEFKSLASQLEGCGQVRAPLFCLLQLQPIEIAAQCAARHCCIQRGGELVGGGVRRGGVRQCAVRLGQWRCGTMGGVGHQVV